MLTRLKQARLGWPTAMSVLGAMILAGLGTWQLDRKQWKEALIAKIADRSRAAPVSLAAAVDRLRNGADIDYLHVTATGRFHHAQERYLYAPGASGLGWHVYTPLEYTPLEAAPQGIVWVNRGFVPDANKSPATRRAGLLAGEVMVTGLARTPLAQGAFQPDNEPRANVWYWPDVAAMSASAFPGRQTLPFAIDAGPDQVPGGLPRGGVTRLALTNRHLEYALTWYALGVVLIIVYSTLVAGRLRAPSPTGHA
jgi:surfeit locus 1 family protein